MVGETSPAMTELDGPTTSATARAAPVPVATSSPVYPDSMSRAKERGNEQLCSPCEEFGTFKRLCKCLLIGVGRK
jgi:hypothetical protein